MAKVIKLNFDEARLKRRIRSHLRSLGFARDLDGRLVPPSIEKDAYRSLHAAQRRDRWNKHGRFFAKAWPTLGRHFAEGHEIDVDKMKVRLELIAGSTWQSDLFRMASLLWSVPVSQGFGRRLRFLVWDDSNSKLVGLFALGDPVFNLKARDLHIGWTGTQRADRLVNILDAYVLGAVPPYNKILGGKLVASIIPTVEVAKIFRSRYRDTSGIISGAKKEAQLVAVTTTSALGRSSLYNRLKLNGQVLFEPIGFTSGYGHFHIPDELFFEMREMLSLRKEVYASNHSYGQGPNWKLRTVRRALELLDMDPHLTRHGMPRQVFLCSLANNARQILCGDRKRPDFSGLKTVDSMSELAVERWVRPRAKRDDSYRTISRKTIESLIDGSLSSSDASQAKAHAAGH